MPRIKSNAKGQTPKATKSVKKAAKSAAVKKASLSNIKVKKALKQPETPMIGKATKLTVKVYDTSGKYTGTLKLPEKTFGVKVNKQLLSQALRVYFTNSHTHTAHTKTRAEVRGGGRKPWRQKGTGNARAGSKRSPLWVGGGITFGPRTRKVKLDLPKKMKRAALISALSAKAQIGTISIINNFEKIQPKTKNIANLLAKTESKTPALLIINEKNKNVDLATRNLSKTTVEIPENLNAYLVWQNNNILISKEALSKFS